MNLMVTNCSELSGTLTASASKSHTVRALFLASLCSGTGRIRRMLDSDDTRAALDVCRGLGAHIEISGDSAAVRGSGLPIRPAFDSLFSRNSGITTKFTLPIMGLRENTDVPIELDAGEQMRARPVMPLVHALNNLGMRITPASEQCAFPLRISGALIGGKIEISGEDSQYTSALLMALACAPNDSEIIVRNLQERPYVDMTLGWLDRLGIRYEHKIDGITDIFTVFGRQIFRAFEVNIPGDFSSASYPIAAAVMVPGSVMIHGLDMNDSQSDKRLVNILRSMGADIVQRADGLKINGGAPLSGITIDAGDIPDLVPTLAVIATRAAGETRIVNVAHARKKETDRIRSMYEGLKAMGANIRELPDGLTVRTGGLAGTKVRGYGDHRTVMALSVAGLTAQGQTVIDTAESINKTYPEYIAHMNLIGAHINIS